MRIETPSCDGCGQCAPYCPVGAILADQGGAYTIDEDECVECGVCLRSAACPHKCFKATPCPWPRSLRPLFSDPTIEHRDSRVPGRGTEESKTNDVTARFLPDEVGLMIEMGRPGLGARLWDVERMTVALAQMGIEVQSANPVRGLIENPKSGRLLPEVLNEKVLSMIVECVIPEDRLHAVLDVIQRTAQDLQSVCSVGLIRRFANLDGEVSGESPTQWIRRQGVPAAPNGKVNLAMGRAPRANASCRDTSTSGAGNRGRSVTGTGGVRGQARRQP